MYPSRLPPSTYLRDFQASVARLLAWKAEFDAAADRLAGVFRALGSRP